MDNASRRMMKIHVVKRGRPQNHLTIWLCYLPLPSLFSQECCVLPAWRASPELGATSLLLQLAASTSQAAYGFAGGLAAAWLSPSAPCRCICESSVDRGVLALVERQLDRCGPEHLTRPGGWTNTLLIICVSFLFGAVVGALARGGWPNRVAGRAAVAGGRALEPANDSPDADPDLALNARAQVALLRQRRDGAQR